MKKKLKMFIVRKYVLAESAAKALLIEHKIQPDECFIDDEWRKNNPDVGGIRRIGFNK